VPSLLPERALPRVRTLARALRSADLAKIDALLVVVPEDMRDEGWNALPRGAWLRSERARRGVRAGGTLSARLDNPAHTLLIVGLLGRGASAFAALKLAGQMLKEATAMQATQLGTHVPGFESRQRMQIHEALLAATFAAGFALPSFKSERRGAQLPRSVTRFGVAGTDGIRITQATSEGNNLARWLTALPGNALDARSYRQRIAELARREGWRMKFFDTRALKRRGAGAFLAVAQGNAAEDAGIVQLQYRPRRARGKLVSLVGKGICFDTGGTNLKAHKSMLDMHTDMEGSAVALGTLLALTRLRAAFPVECWLAITENRIGPRAYKPQDVVTAVNGTRIQVIHTDAEGRMVLADALSLAAERKPALILDFATLTGACVNALTERYSGVFTNRAHLQGILQQAGVESGERTWCFPMDEDFDSDLDSPLADIMQCTADSKGDHILAARFLSRFVPASIAWAHIDLAASQRGGGLGHIATDITGFGVRYAVNLLLEQNVLARLG
jgi:leucyl aminopeptidase